MNDKDKNTNDDTDLISFTLLKEKAMGQTYVGHNDGDVGPVSCELKIATSNAVPRTVACGKFSDWPGYTKNRTTSSPTRRSCNKNKNNKNNNKLLVIVRNTNNSKRSSKRV